MNKHVTSLIPFCALLLSKIAFLLHPHSIARLGIASVLGAYLSISTAANGMGQHPQGTVPPSYYPVGVPTAFTSAYTHAYGTTPHAQHYTHQIDTHKQSDDPEIDNFLKQCDEMIKDMHQSQEYSVPHEQEQQQVERTSSKRSHSDAFAMHLDNQQIKDVRSTENRLRYYESSQQSHPQPNLGESRLQYYRLCQDTYHKKSRKKRISWANQIASFSKDMIARFVQDRDPALSTFDSYIRKIKDTIPQAQRDEFFSYHMQNPLENPKFQKRVLLLASEKAKIDFYKQQSAEVIFKHCSITFLHTLMPHIIVPPYIFDLIANKAIENGSTISPYTFKNFTQEIAYYKPQSSNAIKQYIEKNGIKHTSPQLSAEVLKNLKLSSANQTGSSLHVTREANGNVHICCTPSLGSAPGSEIAR